MNIINFIRMTKSLGKVPSPVHYQSLEKELAPVLGYLKGDVLNAGCGERDIGPFLLSRGARSVENCDVRPFIPGAITCDLSGIPRPDGAYDSVLCNAVIEHLKSPDMALKEFYRLLKPGGYLVLTIPFLQPYHPCPADYRRYTKDGLAELAGSHGFEVAAVLPVHSIAQTIGSILWAYLEEKKRRFLKALFLIPVYIWCRMSERTDASLINTANAYQAVLKKP